MMRKSNLTEEEKSAMKEVDRAWHKRNGKWLLSLLASTFVLMVGIGNETGNSYLSVAPLVVWLLLLVVYETGARNKRLRVLRDMRSGKVLGH